jgi:hypothetical protein
MNEQVDLDDVMLLWLFIAQVYRFELDALRILALSLVFIAQSIPKLSPTEQSVARIRNLMKWSCAGGQHAWAKRRSWKHLSSNHHTFLSQKNTKPLGGINFVALSIV